MFAHVQAPTAGPSDDDKVRDMPTDEVINSTETLSDGVAVHPAGEIDFSRSPTLRAELMQVLDCRQPQRLVINLSEVDYMDSSGVATLVEAMQHQRQKSRKLVLCGLQPKVRSIFQIARLDMIFTIVSDGAEAAEA